MGGYGKIFTQIYESSISSNPDARDLFMHLIVLANADGVIDMTYAAIARRINRPETYVISGIKFLMEPDEETRAQRLEGARLQLLSENRTWGWRIVNHGKYRGMRDNPVRREQWRTAKQRERERKKAAAASSKNDDNDDCHPKSSNDDMSSSVIKGHQASEVSSSSHRENVIHGHPRSSQAISNIVPPYNPPKGGIPFTSRLPLLVETNGWTVDKHKAAKIEFPDGTMPEKFSMLPVDMQRTISLRVKKMRAA